MSYEIIVETAVGLPSSVRQRFGVYKEDIKGVVYMPDKDIQADSDFKNYSPKEFFKIVKKNAGKIRTAFATYEEFSRVVEPLLKEGKDVMVFTISSALSGTFNAFRQYKDILLDDYPKCKIEIIDTFKYDCAGGLLAVNCALNKAKGMSFEENVKWANENKFALHEIGPMDDLRFLAKNGRLSAGKAFFGQLAGVQPVADFTDDGKNVPLGTVKGDTNVEKVSIEYLKATIVDPENQVIFIGHSDREARANKFKKLLEDNLKVKEVVVLSIGQSSGPNIGPGLCAYFYMGKPISKNREEENKLFLSLKESL